MFYIKAVSMNKQAYKFTGSALHGVALSFIIRIKTKLGLCVLYTRVDLLQQPVVMTYRCFRHQRVCMYFCVICSV